MVDRENPTGLDILTALTSGQQVLNSKALEQFQAYYQNNHSASSQTPTMPPQILDTNSWTRLYGSYQFRIFLQTHVGYWNQGKTRTATLEIMRSVCDSETEQDMMIMFTAHAMHFFLEDSLPTDPKEEFNRVQEAVANGTAAATPVPISA